MYCNFSQYSMYDKKFCLIKSKSRAEFLNVSFSKNFPNSSLIIKVSIGTV